MIRSFKKDSPITSQDWDLNNFKFLRNINVYNETIISICLSYDKRFIFSGTNDGKIMVWDIRGGLKIKTLQKHGARLSRRRNR